jgi:hypothetical protein
LAPAAGELALIIENENRRVDGSSASRADDIGSQS